MLFIFLFIAAGSYVLGQFAKIGDQNKSYKTEIESNMLDKAQLKVDTKIGLDAQRLKVEDTTIGRLWPYLLLLLLL